MVRLGTEFCQYIAPNIIPMTFGNVLRLRCLPLSEFEMFYVPKKIRICIMYAPGISETASTISLLYDISV